MSSLADVFRVLALMRDAGVVTEYALGGATAVLFYAEPTRTYDLDVFVLLPTERADTFVSLADAYHWADTHGFTSEAVRVVDPEHLIALALQAGGARRRERAWLLLQSGTVDRGRLRRVLDVHRINVEIPSDD